MVKNKDRSGKALSQAIKDQLTIGVQTSIKFVSYFTKVLVQSRLVYTGFAFVAYLPNFKCWQLLFCDRREVKSFENICTVMARHVTYREFSTGMIRCPATQVVNSAVDDYPVITFTVVLFHLTAAIIFHLLHPEEITTKNNSSGHSTTGNRRLSVFIFARAHRLSTQMACA